MSFAHTKRRLGYKISEVDAFADRIRLELTKPAPMFGPGDITAAEFTPVFWREGYDPGAVDEWMERVSFTLQEWTRLFDEQGRPR